MKVLEAKAEVVWWCVMDGGDDVGSTSGGGGGESEADWRVSEGRREETEGGWGLKDEIKDEDANHLTSQTWESTHRGSLSSEGKGGGGDTLEM